MSTKAEDQKAEAQRENRARKAKQPKRGVKSPKRAPQPRTAHAARATFAKEEASADGHKSRKSTRKSANGAKPDSNLRRKAMRKVRSPEARASRAAARDA